VTHHIIALGEILWDVFPDGPRFGGAPANFGCSAAELGRDKAIVTMVSAVGDDELGRRALEALANRGVHTTGVQVNGYPTGRVDVELDEHGAASYRFAENCAWDHLSWNHELEQLAQRCDAVCFGTLGQRGRESQETIWALVQATPESALRILDVNIREPFISDELILASLDLANVLKLNDEELPVIGRLCNVSGSDLEIMRQVARRFTLRHVALTRGPDGAVIVSEDSVSELPGVPVKVADTVGAGDAFTASMTLGLLAGQNLDTINRNAIATASFVCSQPGATMSFPDQWRHGERVFDRI
jgi:fructokinase